MKTNPYATLASSTIELSGRDGDPDSGKEQELLDHAKRRIQYPAGAMFLLAMLNLPIDLFGVVITTSVIVSPPSKSIAVPGGPELAAFLTLLILHALQACSGLFMRSLTFYRLAYAGAFLSCIPCVSPFVVAGIPFGIWAIAQLHLPSVIDAFALKRVRRNHSAQLCRDDT